jgi:adenylate kinase
MRIVLLGPPGSGKGTQAAALSAARSVAHVSTGDMLRSEVSAGSDLGREAKAHMDRGGLVPDELVMKMVKARLARPDCAQGFVLDGFPRNSAQAAALDGILAELGQLLDAVVYLAVGEEELVRRLSGRRTCVKCQAVYHIDTMKPRVEGICDRCGGDLVARSDETPEVIRKRLEVYRAETEPLVAYYREHGLLREIDGTIGVEAVCREIEKIVGEAADAAE